MKPLATVLRRTLDALYNFTGILAALGLIVICGLMMAMSVGRIFSFNVKAADEIIGWTMVATSFLGLAYTFKNGDLIRVTLLVERFTGQRRRWAELLALTIGAAFLGAFAWFCCTMVYGSWRYNEIAQGVLPVPIWIPQAALALGVTALFFAFLDEIVRVLRGHKPCYFREEPKTIEEIIERASESAV